MTRDQTHPMLAQLARNPEIYPHQLDLIGDRVLLAAIPLAAQAQAAFLDQRALTPQTPCVWVSWEQFKAASVSAPKARLGYLLHAGHCGSTLLSRLVEAAAGARPLREPLPLRSLAEEAADAPAGAALLADEERKLRLGVFERVWAGAGGAVVKATSICNGLVDELGAHAPAAFVYVKPEIYLALLLGGANTHLDLRNFAKMRVRRLAAKTALPGPLSSMSAGELAAMSWFAEATSIAAAARPVHTVNFDRFLADPAAQLAALCRHLGWPADAGAIDAAVAGPIMRQYAKAPEHSYDAATRAAIIAEDSARFRSEIDRGMRWLANAAGGFAAGETALNRFGDG